MCYIQSNSAFVTLRHVTLRNVIAAKERRDNLIRPDKTFSMFFFSLHEVIRHNISLF